MNQTSTIGGASYCMLAIIKNLNRNLFEPIVMLREKGILSEEFEAMGIKVHYLYGMPTIPYNQSFFQPNTLISYLNTQGIQEVFRNQLRELNVDMVYLNNMMLYPYLRTAKEVGCRTIIHIREHWPHDEHQIQMKRARKYVYKYADFVIAINCYSASMFPECKNKISIIYDWFDSIYRDKPILFNEIFNENPEKLKIILFTGGIGRIKGTHEVIKAFSEKITGESYRLLIMGAGTDYKLQFKGMLGFIKRILMVTGWEPYGLKIQKMIKQDSRIFCFPSTYYMTDIYRQSFFTISYFTIPHANLALAEAISLGTVGIAARTEESMEYSNNGKGAILYNINDPSDFYKKIEYVINHYEDAKLQAVKNSAYVKDLFSPSRNINKLNEVFAQVFYGAKK